jgi:energy-coupling factor transporter ATP-binding protein EcfA2
MKIFTDEPIAAISRNHPFNKTANKILTFLNQVPRATRVENHEPTNKDRYNSLKGSMGLLPRKPESIGPLSVSITTAIFGPWGSGKTSLLRCLEGKLKERGAVTIWFEPWRYENEANLLLPLLSEIVSHVSSSKVLKKNGQKQAIKLGKNLLFAAARIAIRGGAAATLPIIGNKVGDIVSDFASDLFHSVGSYKPANIDLGRSESDQFGDQFRELIGMIEPQRSRGSIYNVAIFIDDLDRCDPLQVKRMLESMKLFLSEPGVAYFVALDREQVLDSVAIALAAGTVRSHSDALDIGYLRKADGYLAKFFQFTYFLGDDWYDDGDLITQLATKTTKELANTLSRRRAGAERNNFKADFLDQVEQLFKLTPNNPRAVKTIARHLFFADLSLENGTVSQLVPELAKLILVERWPEPWRRVMVRYDGKKFQRCLDECARFLTPGHFPSTPQILIEQNNPSQARSRADLGLKIRAKAMQLEGSSNTKNDPGSRKDANRIVTQYPEIAKHLETLTQEWGEHNLLDTVILLNLLRTKPENQKQEQSSGD